MWYCLYVGCVSVRMKQKQLFITQIKFCLLLQFVVISARQFELNLILVWRAVNENTGFSDCAEEGEKTSTDKFCEMTAIMGCS